jgi:hypothetical protein
VGQRDLRGAEALVRRDPGAERLAEAAGEREGVALDDEVHVRAVRAAEQRIAHGAPDHAHGAVEERRQAGQQRVAGGPLAQARRLVRVAYDPVSRKLAAASPIALPRLTEALARYEGLTLTELQEAMDACETRFREWVARPENAGRPISEAPDYVDRIALDSLLERRTWWE